ncbi:tyrosine-type recombinase/integrase [Paenibacillus sp. GCM10027626]|uniref:tyrosine-type recombinase/integrase n=1 Tax=Paenibacillus sp. GCM10027626 TaxID=3273411 RepID=UPI00362A4EAB
MNLQPKQFYLVDVSSLSNETINYMSQSIMVNDSYYKEIMLYVSAEEDERGSYNFSAVSNIGMIYLYLHRRGTKRSQSTKKDYVRELLVFLQFAAAIGKADIRELTRADMERYQLQMEQKYPKATTRSKKISIVQSFLKWCYEEDYLAKNITRGLIPVRIDKEEIPEREFDEQVLQQAILYYDGHPKIKSLLLLLGTTGLRLNEVITPIWGDLAYDAKRDRYYLRTITKRGKVRHANIKDYVLEELCEYRRRLGLKTELSAADTTPFYPNRSGGRYSLSSLSSSLSKHMEQAGLVTTRNARVTPHYMRHYFAQAAFSAGAPIGFIAETLGHTSEKTTRENYLRTALKKEHDVSEFVDIHLPGIGER